MTVSQFGMGSRYYAVGIATDEVTPGRSVVYLQRRFVPPPERFAETQQHIVSEGERLDLITAQYLGDPERFWQLCDANGALHPLELTARPGRSLRITLPEGIPGPPHA